MCVWLPDWPLQRIRSAQPELENRPLVLYANAGHGGLRVVTCCRSAAKRGIVPGMPLAEAKGLFDTARRSRSEPLFVLHEPETDRSALRELSIDCGRFSPTVGIEEPDSLLLDLTGCAHLFGGERRLSHQVFRDFLRRRLSVRTAIAETIGTAWAVAHFGTDRAAIISSGQQTSALGPLPISALRLSAAVSETLRELSIRRIEQLQALPRDSFASRFGPELSLRLDQAWGKVAEFIVPVQLPEPIETRWEFEHPAGDRRSLQSALGRLIEQITETLSASGQGAQQLEVHLVGATKQQTSFTVGLLRPCQSASHLMKLVRTRLERITLTEEITGLRLKTTVTARIESRQNRLFDTGDNPDGERELAQLIDRLSNRVGKQRVVHPRLCPDAQPEFAVRWEPLLDVNPVPNQEQFPWPRTWSASSRPLRLHTEPRAVEVTSVVPDGPPLRLFWNQAAYTVTRCWGPERIETGWWRARPIRRDYYRVETESGQRFWLFRRIGRGDWFLHGEFE